MKQIIAQDANGWYTRLNAVLLKHGLTAVPVPDITGPAKAEQVAPLTDKLESMKTDTYYKLASYSDWGSVVKGALMKELTPTGIEATITSVEATIVCRNTAANAHGACTYGTNSNGAKSDGVRSYGTNSNGNNSNGTCSHGSKSYGANEIGRAHV